MKQPGVGRRNMHATLDILLLFLAILSACFCSSNNMDDDSENNVEDCEEAYSNFRLCGKLSVLFHFTNHMTLPKPSSVKHMMSKGQTIPFEFPRLKCIGIDSALVLTVAGNLTGDTTKNQRNVLCVLVLIVYRLLQFHIKRLFGLSTYEYSTPIIGRYVMTPWEDNPENWFYAMWNAILPGFHLYPICVMANTLVRRIFVERFKMVNPGPIMEYDEMNNSSKLEHCTAHSQPEEEGPTITLFTLPTILFNKRLPLRYTTLTFARLETEAPMASEEILGFLLRGVHFAFTLTGNEIDVLVTANENILPIKESRAFLMARFFQPIPTNISIPLNLGKALEERQLPKLSCFHPSTFGGSIEQFERMASLMIIEITSNFDIFSKNLDDWGLIAYRLGIRLKKFFPLCKVKTCLSPFNGTLSVCKLDKDIFVVYEEKYTRRKKRSIVCEFGEPTNVSFVAMVALRCSVYPTRLSDSFPDDNKFLMERLRYACYAKIVKEDMRKQKRR